MDNWFNEDTTQLNDCYAFIIQELVSIFKGNAWYFEISTSYLGDFIDIDIKGDPYWTGHSLILKNYDLGHEFKELGFILEYPTEYLIDNHEQYSSIRDIKVFVDWGQINFNKIKEILLPLDKWQDYYCYMDAIYLWDIVQNNYQA